MGRGSRHARQPLQSSPWPNPTRDTLRFLRTAPASNTIIEPRKTHRLRRSAVTGHDPGNRPRVTGPDRRPESKLEAQCPRL